MFSCPRSKHDVDLHVAVLADDIQALVVGKDKDVIRTLDVVTACIIKELENVAKLTVSTEKLVVVSNQRAVDYMGRLLILNSLIRNYSLTGGH